MKKIFTRIFLLTAMAICIFYLIIPLVKSVVSQTSLNCTEPAVSRQITNKNKWPLWWPGQKINDTLYRFQGCDYRIEKILLNGFEATILNTKDSMKGLLQYSFEGIDSCKIQWTSSCHFSSNPLKRFNQYIQLNSIENNVKNMLAGLKKYFENQENVYGFKIEKQKITESSYMSVKKTFVQYPSTQEIYNMIQSVKDYIKSENGEEAGYPMLHVETTSPVTFEAMVAIPTKSILVSKDPFQLKQMVLGGAVLVAEVKGSLERIKDGEAELKNYVVDYKKMSPAISFQSLVTNRLQQADSSKWVTRLYFPVFE